MLRSIPVFVLSAGPVLAHPGVQFGTHADLSADASWMPVALGVGVILTAVLARAGGRYVPPRGWLGSGTNSPAKFGVAAAPRYWPARRSR